MEKEILSSMGIYTPVCPYFPLKLNYTATILILFLSRIYYEKKVLRSGAGVLVDMSFFIPAFQEVKESGEI